MRRWLLRILAVAAWRRWRSRKVARARDSEVFDLAALAAQRAAGGGLYEEFLRVPSLRCGLYVLAAGREDPQRPHDEDEIYYVERGRGKVRLDGRDREVKSGSVVFVPAGMDHRFHSIAEDLRLLVFFSAARPR